MPRSNGTTHRDVSSFLSLFCGNKTSLWSLFYSLILVNLKKDYKLVWRPILTSSRFLADKSIVNQGWHKSWAWIRKAHSQDCKFSVINISLTYWPNIRCQEKIELANVQVEPVSFRHNTQTNCRRKISGKNSSCEIFLGLCSMVHSLLFGERKKKCRFSMEFLWNHCKPAALEVARQRVILVITTYQRQQQVLFINSYTIIKLIRALWLVNQLWFIVPVNFTCLLNYYIKARPQVFMVYRLINHLWCWNNTRRIRKPLACGSWFTNSSRVLPTCRVVY